MEAGGCIANHCDPHFIVVDAALCKRRRRAAALGAVSSILAAAGAAAGAAGPDWGFDDVRMLSLRVHVLSAPGLPEVDCALDLAAIRRRVDGASRIWSQAGVKLFVESVVREPAAAQDAFRELAKRDSGPRVDDYVRLIPAASRAPHALDVYVVRSLPVNGVFFGRERAVFIKVEPRLRPVEGGTDYPPERVLAHEIGHFLGLGHVAEPRRLLAQGTTGTGIDAAEAEAARAAAAARAAVQGAAAFLETAEAEAGRGRTEAARARLEALLEIPGDSALRRRARALLGRIGMRF
jgi:hypothetical protein